MRFSVINRYKPPLFSFLPRLIRLNQVTLEELWLLSLCHFLAISWNLALNRDVFLTFESRCWIKLYLSSDATFLRIDNWKSGFGLEKGTLVVWITPTSPLASAQAARSMATARPFGSSAHLAASRATRGLQGREDGSGGASSVAFGWESKWNGMVLTLVRETG